MKVSVNQPCEVCEAGESRGFLELRYPECGYPGDFLLRECLGCHLLFNSPRLDGNDLRQLYDKNYYFFNRPRGVEFRRIVHSYRRTFSLLKNNLSTSDNILEIGCAKGYLLSLIKEQGLRVFGIELSEAASSFAKEKFNIPVFCGDLESYCNTQNHEAFSLVMVIDVLEHVPHPAGFMTALKRVVKPGGHLIIDTPNAEAFNIQTERQDWLGFNPFHIFIFNKQNLERLLVKNGFTV